MTDATVKPVEKLDATPPPKVQLDSLVRGRVGNLERVGEGRVYSIGHFDWVPVIDADGHQLILHDVEVIAPPRPMRQRTDIPERLTR